MDDYGNDVRWGPFRLSCQSAGLRAGVWFTEGAHIGQTPADADFAIAEVEGPGDYDGVKASIQAGTTPSCPHAIVTNFNTPLYTNGTSEGNADAQAAAKILIDAGYECLTEAYMGDNPNATPTNLDQYGRFLGWPSTSPVFGIYNEPLNTYTPYMAQFPGWSAYLSEYLI